MKLKRIPEDFRVDELTDVAPAGGPFALYRLTKRWIGTPEAIEAILQCWRIERERISYGGLKDFHAVTQQHLTIEQGPRRDLHQARFDLAYLGQVARPFQAGDVAGNGFHIVLRDLDAAAVAGCQTALAGLTATGRSELLRRPAIRLAGRVRPIHRRSLVPRRSRAGPVAGPGRSQRPRHAGSKRREIASCAPSGAIGPLAKAG